jgi:hypothetical protein
MAAYHRLGSYLLADVLAPVPSAKLHRAVTTAGSSWEAHHLLFLFSDELIAAGLATHAAQIQRNGDHLAGLRGFPVNFRFVADGPVLSCDYVPGRTLAQVLARVRDEMVPLGVDHALTVLQSLAQSILLMHEHDLRHGALSPHSAWVAYEGATLLLDAPVAPVLQTLLPRTPALAAALAPYRPQAAASPFQEDLFALGAILYEMLTLEALPTSALAETLAKATLRAAQEEAPLPAELLAFLRRLLQLEPPFADAAEFQTTLERVLYDGEYSPTTFNMAFLMHTLFRDENEADAEAVKADQGTNFTPFLPAAAAQAEAAVPAAAAPGPRAGRSGRYLLIAGGVLAAALLGGMYYQMSQGNQAHQQAQKDLQSRIAALQAAKEANDAKLAEITKQEEAQKALEQMFGQQVEQGSTAEARDTAKKDLEAARQKAKDLARERREAHDRQDALAAAFNAYAAKSSRNLATPQAAAAFNAVAAKPPTQNQNQNLATSQAAAAFNAVAGKPAQNLAATPAAGAAAAAPAAAPASVTRPTVTQKSVPQAPRAGSLPASLQQSELKVSLKVFVDAAGRPLKVVVLKGVEGNYGYNDAAQNAALASSYAPGAANGKPTSGWLDMEYDFGKAK